MAEASIEKIARRPCRDANQRHTVPVVAAKAFTTG